MQTLPDSSPSTQIEWVNHASFVISTPSARLIVDPWIEGTAFNDGWALLSETRFRYEDFRNISHIWFSHEHPDHFSPPNLKRIDAETRSRISVLYQRTTDGKVAAFCRAAGFRDVTELPFDIGHPVAGTLEALCGRVRNETDSWLCLRTPAGALLNLNDCVFGTRGEVERVKALCGEVEVLFTQFSYANWTGNPEDGESRRRAAAAKLAQMREQIEVLKPRYVVPFASYVWFCSEDNAFMNDGANRIDAVLAALRDIPGVQPVVLYPGEAWVVGASHDSDASVARYLSDYARTFASPRLVSPPRIEQPLLQKSAERFRIKSLARNSARKLRGLPPFTAFLTDHGRAIAFSFAGGLQEVATAPEDCDIVLRSQPLKYCFDNAWGFDTLVISGMFRKPPKGIFRRFEEYQWVAHLNNAGLRLEGPIVRRAKKLWAILGRRERPLPGR